MSTNGWKVFFFLPLGCHSFNFTHSLQMPAKKAIITVKSSGLFVLPEETNHGDTWFNSLGTIPLPQRPPLENPLDKLGPLDNGVGIVLIILVLRKGKWKSKIKSYCSCEKQKTAHFFVLWLAGYDRKSKVIVNIKTGGVELKTAEKQNFLIVTKYKSVKCLSETNTLLIPINQYLVV